MKKNFYDEFVAGGFFEKKASENENTRKALDLDPDVLEKIASELESISNINDDTLEQKLASDSYDESKENTTDSDKEEKEDDKQEKESAEDDNEEKESAEDDKEEKEDDKQEKESAEDQEDDKQEKESAEDDKEEKEDDNEEKESAEDQEGDEQSQARNNANTDNSDPEGDKQDAIRKQAYELAEQKLSSQGYGLFDYVMNKVADEHVATFIVDNAEKLASLSDSSALQYADEIISSVSEKLG